MVDHMKKDSLQIDECQRICNHHECPHRDIGEIPDDLIYSKLEFFEKRPPSICINFDA